MMTTQQSNPIEKESHFLTKVRFTKLVESTVKEHKISYMEAIIHVCEKIVDLEVEDVNKYISPVIKEKVEAEAQRLNFLPRSNELTIE